MKYKWGNASQVDDKREHPIHRCAVPLPQWGRLRYENTAIPKQSLSLGGRQRGGGFAAFSEKILFEYVFSCAFVNDSGNFLNNNIEMIHDLKIGISNNEDSELF